MMLRAIFAVSLAALAAAPAWAQQAKPAAAADDPVVARVNGAELHRSEVLAAQRSLPQQVQQTPIEQIYPALLDQMVSGILVMQAGRKAKLENDPEVKKKLAMLQDRVIQEVYIDRMLEKGVTTQKLHARYDKFVKEAPPREEINARHILLASEDDAKAVIAELKKGGDFATIAKEKTTDPAGKTAGGDLGYFTKEEMVPDFAAAAFKLKKGEYTQTPVKTQFGWHVIKVEDRRTAKPPSFEEVKPQLANEVSRELISEKVKELRNGAKIETFALDGSKPAASGPALAPAPAQAPAPGAPTLAPATAPDQMEKK